MSPVDRLRLNADLMRLVREKATVAPGAAGALAGARIAAQIVAVLAKLGAVAPLPASDVSIYNSGTDETEPRMTTPENPLMKRLLPVYAKHGEALAAVRDAEAAGEKVTGIMKAAVTRTLKAIEEEIYRYDDYGRKPGTAPSVAELAAAYEAQVAAEKAWLEELAGMPTLTLDELSAQAVASLEQKTPSAKFGTREASASTMTADGSVITCVAMDDRRRASGWGGWEIKRVLQFKKDGAVISKATLLSILGGRAKQEINEALRSAFEAQAPALEQEYYDYIVSVFDYQSTEHGGKVPAFVERHAPGAEVIAELRAHSNIINPNGRPGADSWLELDLERVRKLAKRYGEDVAVRWFYKTNAKLGPLENPTLHNDRGGYVEVSGERNGRKVFMRQQRIIKGAPTTGRLFHQFPALLYVDGKFTTEGAYLKLFGDKAAV